jgi:hypothetical protein
MTTLVQKGDFNSGSFNNDDSLNAGGITVRTDPASDVGGALYAVPPFRSDLPADPATLTPRPAAYIDDTAANTTLMLWDPQNNQYFACCSAIPPIPPIVDGMLILGATSTSLGVGVVLNSIDLSQPTWLTGLIGGVGTATWIDVSNGGAIAPMGFTLSGNEVIFDTAESAEDWFIFNHDNLGTLSPKTGVRTAFSMRDNVLPDSDRWNALLNSGELVDHVVFRWSNVIADATVTVSGAQLEALSASGEWLTLTWWGQTSNLTITGGGVASGTVNIDNGFGLSPYTKVVFPSGFEFFIEDSNTFTLV